VVAWPPPLLEDSDGALFELLELFELLLESSLDEPLELLSSSELVLVLVFEVLSSSVVALEDVLVLAVVLLRLSAVASRATRANPAVAATAETASPAVRALARRLPSSRLVITGSSRGDQGMSLRW
jgi:hypothetical protein